MFLLHQMVAVCLLLKKIANKEYSSEHILKATEWTHYSFLKMLTIRRT